MGAAYLCRCNNFIYTYMHTDIIHKDNFLFTNKVRRNTLMKNDFNFFSFSTGMISLLTLAINMLCLLLVLRYYKGLKMLKRLTEEVVIPIPFHAVSNEKLN